MSQQVQVTLSLGSNIDRFRHINAGIDALEACFGEVELSPVYETEAVGFQGSPFLNLVAIVYTEKGLPEVISCLKQIEDDNGRDRNAQKYSSRTLDIDVVTYSDLAGVHHGVELPRAELFNYGFVARPMADLLAEQTVPGQSVSYLQLWQQMDGQPTGMHPVPFERR